jgi:putative redox protein
MYNLSSFILVASIMVLHHVAGFTRAQRIFFINSSTIHWALGSYIHVPSCRFYSHNDKDLKGDAYEEEDGDDIKHRKYYSISGTGKKSSVTMLTNTKHTLHTDIPAKMGGMDLAPQPVEHLLAALLGCTQATAMYVSRMMTPRLFIDRIEFSNFMAYRDERGALARPIDVFPSFPSRLQRVSGTVTVYFIASSSSSSSNSDLSESLGNDAIVITPEQLKTLAEQTEVRCPIANMMHASGCIMDIEWVIGS